MHIYIEPNELPERQQSNVDMNGKLYAVGQLKALKTHHRCLCFSRRFTGRDYPEWFTFPFLDRSSLRAFMSSYSSTRVFHTAHSRAHLSIYGKSLAL